MRCLLLMCLGLSATAEEPLPRIADFPGDSAAAVSYTFDDGLRNQFTIAIPVLDALGLKATFFLIPSLITATIPEAEARKPGSWGGITWDEVRTAAKHGHELGNHTWAHRNLTKLGDADALDEVIKANERIATETGITPISLAYPWNARDERVKGLVHRTVPFTREFQTGWGSKAPDAGTMNRWIEGLIAKKSWGVAMIHGINVGFDAIQEKEVAEHFAFAAAKQPQLCIATFGAVSRYTEERKAATLTVLTREAQALTFTLAVPATSYAPVPLTIVIPAAGATQATAQRAGSSWAGTTGAQAILVDCPPGSEPVTVHWR